VRDLAPGDPAGFDRAGAAGPGFLPPTLLGGKAHRLVENSRFERIDGRWFYVDGVVA
jgi:hypothetical protein